MKRGGREGRDQSDLFRTTTAHPVSAGAVQNCIQNLKDTREEEIFQDFEVQKLLSHIKTQKLPITFDEFSALKDLKRNENTC